MLKELIKYTEVNQATFAKKGYKGLNLFGKIKFYTILRNNKKIVEEFYREALTKKECYIGPFVGEFGNFLLHLLPFISHLNEMGVNVNYCGLELHRPFLRDDNGNYFISNFTSIRDFLKEAKPNGNSTSLLPNDIQLVIDNFINDANNSESPFLNIYQNKNLYWYTYRNWQLNGKQYVYDLSNVYGNANKQNKIVVFPRKMNQDFTPNNGGKWNYSEIGVLLQKYFEEVVFIGHPELSDVDSKENSTIKFSVSGNNEDVLRECATAKLILTQHSGAMHVGGYVKTPVLLIFKGKPPIKGLDDSIRFRENFDYNKVDLVFSLDEIETYLINKMYE